MSRRPPARRRPARRRSRKTSGGEQLVLVVGGLVVAWALFMGLLSFLAAHPWVLVVLVLLVGGAVAAWVVTRQRAAQWERVRSQGLRYALTQLDALHHRQFEHAVRDLMRRDGCADAVQVGGAGDNGADVKATDPYGRRWVIQCKHRRAGLAGSPVGTPDLYVLNGTGRPVHKGDVVVLVTNGRFSKPAVEFARSQRLHLVDRAVLGEWASGSRPLWELLRAVPPPRRPTPLS
ncbi:restriction endonuclease [Streptomyces sp. NPDC127114]|uniref:restriction endonuclease n=1 Tax=Streptomyces sp. NPDC127114 TaxID=3345366 RepID=UPI00363ADC03